jgi:protein SCO1/2
MNPRLIIVTGVVAALAFATLLAGYLTRSDDPAGGRDATADGIAARSTGFRGSRLPAGVRAPDFDLRDESGDPIRMRDLRGHPAVVTFLYSNCRDTCPATAQQIRGALDQLGHDVPALAVSVDPANDTPERAKSFLLRQKLTGRMRFLLGSRAQLEPVWKAYGIRPQGQGFEHSAYVLLIDKRGRQRIGFPVDQLTPEGLAHDIRKLESET